MILWKFSLFDPSRVQDSTLFTTRYSTDLDQCVANHNIDVRSSHGFPPVCLWRSNSEIVSDSATAGQWQNQYPTAIDTKSPRVTMRSGISGETTHKEIRNPITAFWQ